MFSWTVAHVSESECPVSNITPRSFELVQIVKAMQDLKESTGAALGLAEMPGSLVDGVRVCRSESDSVEAAMDEANT